MNRKLWLKIVSVVLVLSFTLLSLWNVDEIFDKSKYECQLFSIFQVLVQLIRNLAHTTMIEPYCNGTQLVGNATTGVATAYGCYLGNSTTSLSTPLTTLLVVLYSLLGVWGGWELSFHCYRSKTIVSSLFSRTTWTCVLTFFVGIWFVCYHVTKKYSYDDRVAFQTFRGLADMAQFTLAMFVVTVWNDLAKSLHKHSSKRNIRSPFSRVLDHCGMINISYICFRMIETIFRIPAPHGLAFVSKATQEQCSCNRA